VSEGKGRTRFAQRYRLSHRAASAALLASMLLVGVLNLGLTGRHASAEHGGNPSSALAERLSSIDRSDPNELFAVAAWAAEQQLDPDAYELCEQVLELDAAHDDAFSLLWSLDSDRSLAVDSETYREARKLLPRSRFTETQTTRFVILSDAGPHWTREQAERLERAHREFMRFCRRLHLRPLPLRNKLVCILFASSVDYRRFAAEQDGVHDAWMMGYYSPRHDWTVFFDVQSSEPVREAHRQIESMEMELSEIRQQIAAAERNRQPDQVTSLRREASRFEQHLGRERRRINSFASDAGIATTMHEALHHLAFHCGVQSRRVQYPLWMSEGLATCFETDAPNEAFGPDRDYSPRREEFQRLLREDLLLPLNALVQLANVPDQSDQTITTIYHQSYALMGWLCRFRAEQLGRYVALMRGQPAGRPTPARHLELFEQAFGDVESLETSWLSFERDRLRLDRVAGIVSNSN
jgi:hypothetical protein